jgi:hypothetical protein
MLLLPARWVRQQQSAACLAPYCRPGCSRLPVLTSRLPPAPHKAAQKVTLTALLSKGKPTRRRAAVCSCRRCASSIHDSNLAQSSGGCVRMTWAPAATCSNSTRAGACVYAGALQTANQTLHQDIKKAADKTLQPYSSLRERVGCTCSQPVCLSKSCALSQHPYYCIPAR